MGLQVVGASLVERLGHPAGTPIVVVSADQLGLCHAANLGVYDALRRGLASTAGLMVPCPWARDAAAQYRGEDVGVQLTVNAELDHYRWGPITHAPSLLDGDGGFPRTPADLWEHADVDELRRECRAQVERAVQWGIDVTHLSAHLDALTLRPEFFDVVLELACDFRLPLRLPAAGQAAVAGFPLRELAVEAGVTSPDVVLAARAGAGAEDVLAQALTDPAAEVTELVVNPAVDTPELRALLAGWPARVADHALITTDGTVAARLARAGVVVTGYRALRDVMRAG